MSFYAPLTSEIFYDPIILVNAPLVQDSPPEMPSTFFDYNKHFDYDSFLQDQFPRAQFCIDAFQILDEPGIDVHLLADFYLPADDYSAESPALPEFHSACISPPIFADELDAWLASQVDDQDSPASSAAASSSSSPASSTASQLAPDDCVSFDASTSPSTARPLKRKTDDSDYEADADTASESSDYVPHRPAKRPATRKRVVQPPLPDSLQPIRVGSTKSPLCPLPGCGASLEAKDSAWRGHFKRFHHDELCLARGCRGLVAGTCKARCPLPESCASDHGNKHTHGASAGAMSIESVGRHLLNVHIKVAYRCPLCGLQNEWRESACVRHIRRCAEKHGKQMSC